jgi:hypothetical protein
MAMGRGAGCIEPNISYDLQKILYHDLLVDKKCTGLVCYKPFKPIIVLLRPIEEIAGKKAHTKFRRRNSGGGRGYVSASLKNPNLSPPESFAAL